MYGEAAFVAVTDWFSLDGKGRALLPLKVQPRAARARIDGLVDDGNGGSALKIAVTAPPEGGRANQAVIELLARTLGIAKSSIDISVGAGSRRKLARLAQTDPAILARLRRWSTP